MASPEPETEAPRYAAACGAAAERAGGAWTFRLGETRVTIEPGPAARFAGLVLHFTDLTALEARAAPYRTRTGPGSPRGGGAGAAEFQLTLRCRSARCAP